MKVSKGLSARLYDFRAEMRKYRFRPIKFNFPTRGTREDFWYDGTFYEAVGLILAVAQLFGIMPVSGIRTKSPRKLKFRKFSIRFVLCVVYIAGLFWISLLDVIWIFKTKMEFGKLINFIFDFTNLLSFFSFLELARKWPSLMIKWDELENVMPKYKYQLDKQKMAYEIKMVSFMILFISMAEHLLSITVGAHGANNCPLIRDPIRAFYVANYPQVFLIFEYSGVLGTLAKFLNVVATFVWSYTDLFVIIVSIGLTSRFRKINEDLLDVKGKSVHPGFWSEYRLYYREVSNLVSHVDSALAKIILISISNNLFFICVQLLRSLDQKPTFAHAFYFWFSLIYLIGRTIAVSLYSASINDESKKPLDVFRAVSRQDWCIEVKRFSEEVANDVIALSGMKFFNLTRKLVLSVAGTIVTYELVLIQFSTRDSIDYDPCDSGEKACQGSNRQVKRASAIETRSNW